MAKKKRKISVSPKREADQVGEFPRVEPQSQPTAGKFMLRRWQMIAGFVILVGLGVWAFKSGMIVAATVNGKPIFKWQLTKTLVSRFGTQTLESMITEQLIADAAQKDGIVISQADVDKKVGGIVKSLGENVNLDELLKYQGMTKADFEHQIRLQLTVEKILSKDVTIEEKDVDTFITENRKTMVASEEAALREEARVTILSQKVSEKIQPWLGELKSKARVVKYLQ